MSRSILFQQAKLLAQQKNIPKPIYRNSTIISLTNFIQINTQPAPPRTDIIKYRFMAQNPEELKQAVQDKMFPDTKYFISFLDEDNHATRIAICSTITNGPLWHDWYQLFSIIEKIRNNHDEYFIVYDNLTIVFHRQVNVNPILRNMRDGSVNCACNIILEEINKQQKSKKNDWIIKNVMEINTQYFESGIDNEGLQLLADRTYYHLVVQDIIGEKWQEFMPKSYTKINKLILLAHNKHLELNTVQDFEQEKLKLNTIPMTWFNTKEDVKRLADEYEAQGNIDGMPIFSKLEMVAYITPENNWKSKFDEHENYQDCFTSASVGKAKFIEAHPEHKYGMSHDDPFYDLLMDADLSGFYCRTESSNINNSKYDMNSSYKSFAKSGLFNGFAEIEAVFTVNKLWSEALLNSYNHGLVFVEWSKLNADNLNAKIYYECDGWQPIEIVKSIYNETKHKINPFIKSFAYASSSWNTKSFDNMTNGQFRSFIGKCVSQSFSEVWRTYDYFEYMRARYVLQDRITDFSISEPKPNGKNLHIITYKSNTKPWNLPIVSVYVKAHQKYNLFKQYNKLINNGIIPVSVSVDGIEVKFNCDSLFDIGKNQGQWKTEAVNENVVKFSKDNITRVLDRETIQPRGTIPFHKNLAIPKYFHISGPGGNGKSEFIVNLAKAYPKIMFLGPTNEAVKNLIDRADSLNIKINCDTYHRVFGFGCPDVFPRFKYNKFIVDECSMLSAENLKIFMKKLSPSQSLMLSGDFWQLPCVMETPIYEPMLDGDNRSNEYKRFKVKELKKNYRQKEDPAFFDLCNKLRTRLSIDDANKIIILLNKRVKKVIPEASTLEDIHICGINTQVDSINNKYKLKVGCKVICNMKCSDQEGITIPNGAIGMVVEFEDTKLLKIDWGSTSISKISTFKGVGRTPSKKARFTPAYALTVHKSQGKTIKHHVIINPSRLFEKNHLYVALTRATKFKSIILTEPITLEILGKTAYIEGQNNPAKKNDSNRLIRMVNAYIEEEPKLTVEFLQTMRDKQKNECCYCGVNMSDKHLESNFITLERVDDSQRHILTNIKLACFACNSSHRKI